jgi:hypothetical protein
MALPDRVPAPAACPWRRPRAELLILALVAAVTLSPVYGPNEQDTSRICLSRALLAGRVSDDRCFPYSVDSSRYHGHYYSNKAPGMSVLEIAPAEAVGLPNPIYWGHEATLRLWAVHVLASGIPFLLCIFLVGRISEGLAPGFGAPAMVALGLGTLLGPLAASGFDHVPAAGLGFLAFVLAWRRHPFSAGLAAGAALTVEYEAAAILLIVGAYTALLGRRALGRYVAGALPGAILLGAYDWAAFGAPWHNPLSYSNNDYRQAENSGVLGIHLPNLHATGQVFLGDRGLLVASPVVLAAAAGLVLLWRRGLRAEALVCGAVTAAFVVAECGYFIPYGGDSPGPRFLAPALPFLALGLGPAFARYRRATTVLTAVSVVATTAVILTWAVIGRYGDTIWGEIGGLFTHRGTSLRSGHVSGDVFVWDAGSAASVAVVAVLAAITFAVTFRPRGGAGRLEIKS